MEAVPGDDGVKRMCPDVLRRVPTVWSAIISSVLACGTTVAIVLGTPRPGSPWIPVSLLVCVGAVAFVTDLTILTKLVGPRNTRPPFARKALPISLLILLALLTLFSLYDSACHWGWIWSLALAQILLHLIGTTAWIVMLSVPYSKTQAMTAFIVRFIVRAVDRLQWPGRAPNGA